LRATLPSGWTTRARNSEEILDMFSSSRGVQAWVLAAALAAIPVLAACSDSGKGNAGASTAPSSSSSAAAAKANVCKPVAGTTLVVLADDKKSQASDNIIPAVNTKVAKAPLTDALNAVSKVLDQDALTGLNRETSANKKPADVAATFVADKKLGEGLSGGSGSIVIGTQDFAEATTLGNVYKDVLSKAGYSASVKTIGSRDLLEPALEKGEIQVVPEYAASLNSFLAKKQGAKDNSNAEITKTVEQLKTLAAKAGITVLDAATATDQNAFAVTKGTADKYKLTSMSDVATNCGTTGVTFGAGANCTENVFCADAIKKTYGISIELKALDYDGALTRNALKQGRILIGEVFSADADLVKAGS
jgi:osmoprotectant transport system substrate-binding protein